MEQVLEEAHWLAEHHVTELVVIAQDTTRYGCDLYGKCRLPELLRELCHIDGIRWVRVLYSYPERITEELLDVMAEEPHMVPYLDMPIQHCDEAILRRMNRPGNEAYLRNLIAHIRERVPDVTLRTTIITGFPGETKEQFNRLGDFLHDMEFDRMGCFAYSEEEGTYSARNLPDDVPEEVKQSRVERVMALQNEISLENNRARIGQLERVIIDSRQGDFYVGRSQYDSPEVDQEILIPAAGRRLIRGCFYQVRITAAEDYDLYGELETK